MGSCRSCSSIFASIVISILLFNSNFNSSAEPVERPRGDLHKYSEIHEAKHLINVLSSKLHVNLQTFQTKYENLQQQSSEYFMRSRSTQDEIKMLNKLKQLLNDLTKNSSSCDKFYTNFDFTAARQIVIKNTDASALPKDFTVALQVNHCELIDNGLALANGNDLRVYFQKDEDCKPREIDRILKNIATTNATVLFKLQEDLVKTVRDRSAYYLVYGNKDASKAKHNPENVYLFYDDFYENSNLEKNWQKNWGSVGVENGSLKIIGDTPTADNTEISIFVKHGHEWEDIEVELDFNERNNDVYPGPFLRVEDARIQSTSAWWFEYHSGTTQCTMRAFKNNQDGSWLYKGTLTKTLSPGSWTHAKYRLVGDRFSHWINDYVIHNNVQVASKWMINKGTFGLGCYKSDGCHTSYDNIKITKYVPILPTVSLAEECKVDMKKFIGLGTSENNPAASCKQIHDVSLKDGKHRLKNGVYWIKTSTDRSAPTYCDLMNGGWTLVGKISGFVSELHKFWLIRNVNVPTLDNAALPSVNQVGCIDARYLATYHASTLMFSSGENKKGIGAKWVQWSLPEGRESGNLWTHSVGLSSVSKAKMYPVNIKAWDGSEQVCYQNRFGIMPHPKHGGSYPSATYNTMGNTDGNDYCMAVGVQTTGTTVDGWTHVASDGFDSPRSNFDWPNASYKHESPYVAVWLK